MQCKDLVLMMLSRREDGQKHDVVSKRGAEETCRYEFMHVLSIRVLVIHPPFPHPVVSTNGVQFTTSYLMLQRYVVKVEGVWCIVE